MKKRWIAAGMLEASKQFRRVNGHLHLAALRASLARHVGDETVGAELQHSGRERGLMLTGPPPKFHGTRDILPVSLTGDRAQDLVLLTQKTVMNRSSTLV